MPTITEADHLTRVRAVVEQAASARAALDHCGLQLEILLTTMLDSHAQQNLIGAMGEEGAASYVQELLAQLEGLEDSFKGMGKPLREAKDGGRYLRAGVSSHYRALLQQTPEVPPDHEPGEDVPAPRRGRRRKGEEAN